MSQDEQDSIHVGLIREEKSLVREEAALCTRLLDWAPLYGPVGSAFFSASQEVAGVNPIEIVRKALVQLPGVADVEAVLDDLTAVREKIVSVRSRLAKM
jgi:hypothetical protein